MKKTAFIIGSIIIIGLLGGAFFYFKASMDDSSGYRYYTEKSLEKVRVINVLKDLDFSLKEIKAIVENETDDSKLLDFLHKKVDDL